MSDLLDNLNEPQRMAVQTTGGPVLILAGAGSGKTRALTHRIAYLITEKSVYPDSILAVTFTNKAANEMIKRVDELLTISNSKFKILNSKINQNNLLQLPWLGTFHRICVKILRRELNQTNLGLTSSFSIFDASDSLAVVKRVCKELSIDIKKYSPHAIQSYISGAKTEMIGPDEYMQYASDGFQKLVTEVYPKYQKLLISQNVVDFDDILGVVVDIFNQYPDILRKYQTIFRYIMIDEYQDTNEVQYRLVKLLAMGHRNICVVGDDNQAIYGWRGANFHNILNFKKDYPDAVVIKLEQNYRSTKNIVDAAAKLISYNQLRTNKTLFTEIETGSPLTQVELDDERDEAQFVANEINGLGVPYDDVAILYRTNAQSRALEEAMIRANISYKVVGGVRFYDRKEVKDILAYLRLIINPEDEVSLARAVESPPRGIGKKTLESYLDGRQTNQIDNKILTKISPFIKLINAWREQSKQLTPTQLIDMIIVESGYKKWLLDGTLEAEIRFDNLKELVAVSSEYDDLGEFLEHVSLIQDIDSVKKSGQGDEAVTLMTLHNAKGLEFPVVFIVGCEEGLFPNSKSSMEPAELEEERRLMYVGMTRARRQLYICYASARRTWGGMSFNLPSRFLKEIPEELVEKI